MILIEVLTSSIMASIVLLASTQACFQVHKAITKQNNLSILQSEAIQAFHMMGLAIQHAQIKTGSPKSSLLASVEDFWTYSSMKSRVDLPSPSISSSLYSTL